MQSNNSLIVGLGNPGRQYERTRHNLGFIVLRHLAKKWGIFFKKVEKLEGELALLTFEERNIYFFLPTTFMNLSGRAVKKALDYYKIPFKMAHTLLVVVDDVYLDFGDLRLKEKGGTGGHKGLKSIEEYLLTDEYTRLRLGIGPKEENCLLEDYVLGKFTEIEQNSLPEFVKKAELVIEQWIGVKDAGENERQKSTL